MSFLCFVKLKQQAFTCLSDKFGLWSLTMKLLMTGNGLFLFGMAEIKKDLNFLGLEVSKKVSLAF